MKPKQEIVLVTMHGAYWTSHIFQNYLMILCSCIYYFTKFIVNIQHKKLIYTIERGYMFVC